MKTNLYVVIFFTSSSHWQSKSKIHLSFIKYISDEDIKRFNSAALHHIKNGFSGSPSANEKLNGIRVLDTKETTMKKINVSFIVYFCLGKDSLFLTNTLW